ncbi:hypothetical protein RclHR1_17820003 [Rhizophagus clarus]|uniref:Putative restriction endonuclease domain-containing protein n=1 Tax=Rhizophagus clarus TaxID=94130 RepID=A0A2Z6RDT4_9GLOM|nr:hypothetical protein RclHR1_17820003 [Rhizophagus clarus]GES75217.1 hypothetical protein GLOIN_2v1475899 [Rhizophagus clarus]
MLYALEERFKLARDTLLNFIKQDIIKENTTEKGTAEKESIEEEDTKFTKSGEFSGFVILRDVSLEEFHELRIGARKFKVYIRLVEGDVIAYEMPSPAHSYVAGELIYLIRAWSHHLQVGSELDITVRRNTEYISDVTVEPRQPGQRQHGTGSVSQPRMIIEIGVAEAFGSLHSLALEYFSNSTQTNFIQVYLSIKIFPRHENNTVTMIATIYLRNNEIPARNQQNRRLSADAIANPTMTRIQNTTPNRVISFGTSPLDQRIVDSINSTGVQNDRIVGFIQPDDAICSRAGMEEYQVNIQSGLLFNGFPGGVPQGTANNLIIDLWEIQQIVLDRLEPYAP